MIDIKKNVQPGKVVTFRHYFNGQLWYNTEDGNIFPVPILDLGSATVAQNEKAMLFMRYMCKWNATLAE